MTTRATRPRRLMAGVIAASVASVGIAIAAMPAGLAIATESATGQAQEGVAEPDMTLRSSLPDGHVGAGSEVAFTLEVSLPDDGDDGTTLWASVTSVTASVDGMPLELSPDAPVAEGDPSLGTISEGQSLTLSGTHAVTDGEMEAGRLTCVADAKLAQSSVDASSGTPVATSQGIVGRTLSETVSLSGGAGRPRRAGGGTSLPQTGRGNAETIALVTVTAVAGVASAATWLRGRGKATDSSD